MKSVMWLINSIKEFLAVWLIHTIQETFERAFVTYDDE